MIFCMTVAEPDPDADAALEDCIARIAGGDKDALADLYNRTRPAVYTLPCQSSKTPTTQRIFSTTPVCRCGTLPADTAGRASLWPGC